MSLRSRLLLLVKPKHPPHPLLSRQTFFQANKYLLSGLFGLVFGTIPVSVFIVGVLHINYVVASVVAYAVVGTMEFLIRRFWVFTD